MRLTVCQLSDDRAAFEGDWQKLRAHVAAEKPDLVLLPELPFATWFGIENTFEPTIWRDVMARHEAGDARLRELEAPCVISTRSVERAGKRLNEAFAAFRDGRRSRLHDKRYLPEEPGFYEASWYQQGDGVFDAHEISGAVVGVQICSELWILDESRRYGSRGVDLIVTPRATAASSVEKWLVAGRAAAMLAGAYSASSNRHGRSEAGGFEFGGVGWVIDPDGAVMAQTSKASPCATVDLDLAVTKAAKATYPRYLK